MQEFLEPRDYGYSDKRVLNSELAGLGVNYTSTTYAVTVEALLPGNRATGNHPGVIAQFHLYFDDLFRSTLGTPIVDWFKI